MPFLAPGDLAPCGLAGRRHHHRQPARGRGVACCAPRCCPGLLRCDRLQLVAPQPRRAPVRDRSHVQPPRSPDADLPDEREPSASRWPGATPPRRSQVWRCVAEALARGRRHASRPARCRAATRPAAARVVVGDAGPMGARRRDRSGRCSTRFGIGERVAWLEVDLDVLLDAARTATRATGPVSRYPSQRRRPRLRGRRRRARVGGRGRHPLGRRRAAVAACGCSTSTAGRASADGRRSLAYSLRLQAADRTLTDADVAEARAADHRRRRVHPRRHPPRLTTLPVLWSGGYVAAVSDLVGALVARIEVESHARASP